MSEQSKLEQERDRLAHAHRSRSDVYNEDWNSFNSFKAGFDAATEIHQHLLAEKDKRIERLRDCLLKLKHLNNHKIEEEMWRIDAALQEETKW